MHIMQSQLKKIDSFHEVSKAFDAFKAKFTLTKEQSEDVFLYTIVYDLKQLQHNDADLKNNVKSIIYKINSQSNIEKFNVIKTALEIFLDPKILRVSLEENILINSIYKQTHPYKKELQYYADAYELASIRDVQSIILDIFHQEPDFNTISECLEDAETQLKKEALEKRLTDLSRIAPFITNYIHFDEIDCILEVIKMVSADIESDIKLSSESFHIYNSTYNTVIREYPKYHINTLIKKSVEEAVNLIVYNIKNKKMSESDILIDITNIKNAARSSYLKTFKLSYDLIYKNIFTWFDNNIKYITKHYNQGLDIHTNLRDGVCLSNSLNRSTALIQDPSIASQNIQMGSSSSTRMLQSIYTYEKGPASERLIGKYQLDLTDMIDLSTSQTPMEEMERFAVTHQNDALLLLLQYNNDGHAMNIQIDFSRNTFRIFDDNLGILEYPNITIFKQSLQQYLQYFYQQSATPKIYLYAAQSLLHTPP